MAGRRQTTPASVAGSLLLAHPGLRDDNFSRTVVLMSFHDAEGARGLILNRPLGRRLGELKGEFALGPLASIPLYTGGPVEPGQLLLAGWQVQSDGVRLHFGLELDRAAQLVVEEGAHVRGFLGYSGWSGGQLEGELRAQSWVVALLAEDLLALPHDASLWRTLLGREGDEWRLLAGEPEDPERN